MQKKTTTTTNTMQPTPLMWMNEQKNLFWSQFVCGCKWKLFENIWISNTSRVIMHLPSTNFLTSMFLCLFASYKSTNQKKNVYCALYTVIQIYWTLYHNFSIPTNWTDKVLRLFLGFYLFCFILSGLPFDFGVIHSTKSYALLFTYIQSQSNDLFTQ